MRALALLAVAVLAGCTSPGGGSGGGGSSALPKIGAFVDPDNKGQTEQKVLDAETLCGCHFAYLKTYYGFPPAAGYSAHETAFWTWAVSTNHSTMVVVVSSRVGANGCTKYADDLAGVNDPNIDALAKELIAVAAPIAVDLFPEPSDNPPELCANTTPPSSLLAVQAWQYVASRLRADGVHATFIQSLGQPLWELGGWQSWYAGDADVDEVSEHIYNTTGPANFHDAICTEHPATKPYAITETASGPAWQVQWGGTIAAACPNDEPEQVDWFDRPAYQPYQWASPAAAQAFGSQ